MKFKHQNQETIASWGLNIAGSAIVLLVLGASYTFGFAYFSDQLEGKSTRCDQLNALLQTTSKAHEEYQLQQGKLNQLTQLTSSMRGRLPSTLQKKPFETQLASVSKEVGIALEKTRWAMPKETETHSSIAITVNGSGSFASICSFLEKVSHLTRITKVSRLSVKSSQVSESYPFEVTFDLVFGVKSNDTEQIGSVL